MLSGNTIISEENGISVTNQGMGKATQLNNSKNDVNLRVTEVKSFVSNPQIFG
jgi:hypothetical protein